MRTLLITLAFALTTTAVLADQPADGASDEGAPSAPNGDVSDDERAARHFRVGLEFYADENFEEALGEFQAAYALSPRPALLYNIGLAHDRLGQWAQARDSYIRFLDAAPSSPNAANATERLARARRRAADQDEPPQSEVDAGVEVDLEPSSRGRSPVVGWSLLGLAAGAGVTALATGLVAHGVHGDLEEACGDARVCAPDQRSDIDRGRRLARASTAMTFIGVAAAIGGTLTLLLGGGERADATQVSVSPLRGGGFLSTSTAF